VTVVLIQYTLTIWYPHLAKLTRVYGTVDVYIYIYILFWVLSLFIIIIIAIIINYYYHHYYMYE